MQAFQKYLSYKKDHSELLYYILRQITLDTLAFQKALHGNRITTLEISEKDLLDRVIQSILIGKIYKCDIIKYCVPIRNYL